jgi:hypothetical protein
MNSAVSLSDLVASLSRRGTPLAMETGLFITLEATEALIDAPRSIALNEIVIHSDGGVQVGQGRAAGEASALAGLARLIESLVSPLPLSVRTFIERIRSGSIPSIQAARAELEALLVPLNRSAARRVLGRIAREQKRNSEGMPPAVALPVSPAPIEHAKNDPIKASKSLEPFEPQTDAVDTVQDRSILEALQAEILASDTALDGLDAVDTDPGEPFELVAATDTVPTFSDAQSTTPDSISTASATSQYAVRRSSRAHRPHELDLHEDETVGEEIDSLATTPLAYQTRTVAPPSRLVAVLSVLVVLLSALVLHNWFTTREAKPVTRLVRR